MAAESRSKYGRSIDLALFTEYALTAGKQAPPPRSLSRSMTRSSRPSRPRPGAQHLHCLRRCFSRRSGHRRLLERRRRDRPPGTAGRSVCQGPPRAGSGRSRGSNRSGRRRKPGTAYNVLDLDFGRVGVQICYDIEYPEGWRRLAEKGAELCSTPLNPHSSLAPACTPPPTNTGSSPPRSGTTRRSSSLGRGSSPPRSPSRSETLVQEIDLSYLILPWSSRLRNGEAFREAFGDRVGYRYSESEDRGIFWSNDPGRSIGQMARSLGLLETPAEQQARARDAQDRLRGGPAR